jgi:hypothetical protein
MGKGAVGAAGALHGPTAYGIIAGGQQLLSAVMTCICCCYDWILRGHLCLCAGHAACGASCANG